MQACGLEIVVSRGGQAAGEDTPVVSSVQQDPQWPAFLHSLKEKGFFRGEIDGSQLYRTLMSNAEAFFADTMCKKKDEQGVGDSSRSSAAEIRQILGSVQCEGKKYRDTEDSLEPPDGQCLSRVWVLPYTSCTWQHLHASLEANSASWLSCSPYYSPSCSTP